MRSPRLVLLVSALTAVALAAVVWAMWPRDGSGAGSGRSANGSSAGPGQTGGAVPGASSTVGSTAGLPAGVVGTGCTDYAAAVPTGPGALGAMAGEPVVAAIDGSPLLRTFAAALTGRLNRRVDLRSELGRGPLTVFAPVDSAFALVPADRMATLRRQAPELRTLLRGHIVAGALDASRVSRSHRTLAGTTVQVTGSGGSLTVDGAPVICGGLRTTNGVLYLVASVLSLR